jgi:hypothetical protein
MRIAAFVTFAACAIASAAGVFFLRSIGNHLTVAAASTPASVAMPSKGAYPSSPKVGVISYNLQQFEKTSGIYPAVDVKFVQWGSAFPAAQIRKDYSLGVTTIIVLEPNGISLAGLANGDDDSYLRSWGRADGELELPVTLSFAPEANGSWYRWGARRISSVLYRNMWHRVHDVILRAGARRITWLWQVNSVWPGSEALRYLWPGSADIDEVGIDGQLSSPQSTFASVFDQTVTQLRDITRDPVMISEVAVGSDRARPAQITNLFMGARQARLAALVFFDAHSAWQFDHDPEALRAFRAGVHAYTDESGS